MADAVVLEARVRMKKRDGRAAFSEKCLRWTPDTSPEISADGTDDAAATAKPIVVAWSTVQDQQVSSLSSPKAMIRLRMANNNVTLVLEFVSAKSLEHAFEARDQAKALIAKWILSNSSKQQQRHGAAARTPLCNATEIKQRAALLAANPTLKRQHTEMVNEGLISEEDFWASRRHLIANEASKRQKTGKTSAILTDLSGDNDAGGNVVKYNLNAEVIHQIFIQYPAVHLAYQAQVPDKMTETEFWGAFFKSKYFHRDRKAGHEDMFTKYEEKEKEMTKGVSIDPRAIVDPLVDLTSTEEDVASVTHSLQKARPGPKDDGSNITIAKFNRHGAYVLDPSHAGKLQHGHAEATKPRANYHDNVREATLLDDLQPKAVPPYNPLTLEDESRYFQQPSQDGSNGATATTLVDATSQFQRVCRASFALDLAFPPATTSMNVLKEVVSSSEGSGSDASTSFGATTTSGGMTAEYIPTEFKKQVYNQFHDVNELLRHFLSFKAKVAQGGDADAQHKLNKIVEKMGSKYDELMKIREALPPHERNLLAPLLKPFDDQLNLAFI
ncbi:putative general transcription factor iih subunit, partial [Globisporangium splendens]